MTPYEIFRNYFEYVYGDKDQTLKIEIRHFYRFNIHSIIFSKSTKEKVLVNAT